MKWRKKAGYQPICKHFKLGSKWLLYLAVNPTNSHWRFSAPVRHRSVSTLCQFLDIKAGFPEKMLINPERAVQFHTGSFIQNVYSMDFDFWLSGHFESDLRHSALGCLLPSRWGHPACRWGGGRAMLSAKLHNRFSIKNGILPAIMQGKRPPV